MRFLAIVLVVLAVLAFAKCSSGREVHVASSPARSGISVGVPGPDLGPPFESLDTTTDLRDLVHK